MVLSLLQPNQYPITRFSLHLHNPSDTARPCPVSIPSPRSIPTHNSPSILDPISLTHHLDCLPSHNLREPLLRHLHIWLVLLLPIRRTVSLTFCASSPAYPTHSGPQGILLRTRTTPSFPSADSSDSDRKKVLLGHIIATQHQAPLHQGVGSRNLQ